MHERVVDLRQLKTRYQHNASFSSTLDLKTLYEGLVKAVDKEITEFEDAIVYLELRSIGDERQA